MAFIKLSKAVSDIKILFILSLISVDSNNLSISAINCSKILKPVIWWNEAASKLSILILIWLSYQLPIGQMLTELIAITGHCHGFNTRCLLNRLNNLDHIDDRRLATGNSYFSVPTCAKPRIKVAISDTLEFIYRDACPDSHLASSIHSESCKSR